MKYITLSYGTPADWDAGREWAEQHAGEEQQYGPADDVAQELIETGEFVYGRGWPTRATPRPSSCGTGRPWSPTARTRRPRRC